MNRYLGIGRLVRDAELRYTAGGTAVTKFSICINKVWKDKDGNRQERPNFFDCVLWGKYGETMQKYLTKGKQIAVDGELDQSAWQNNGKNYSKVQIIVNELQLLQSPKGVNTEPPPKNDAPPDDVPF